jgi:two-component system chemotaxis response regulator CheY
VARILVVEDDDDVRQLLRRILERAEHEVDTARNGREATPLYQTGQTDLVITNILMPEKDGLEVIQELRKKDPAAKIIAISGGGQIGAAEYLDVAKRFGAARTMRKPIDRRELLATIAELLERTA